MKGFFRRLGILLFILVCIPAVWCLFAYNSQNEPVYLYFALAIFGLGALFFLTGFIPWLLKALFHTSVATATVAAKTGAHAVSNAKLPEPGPVMRWLFTGKAKKNK